MGCWRQGEAMSPDRSGQVSVVRAVALVVAWGWILGPMAHAPYALTGQEPGSQLLFTIPEHDLYPESVAHDPGTGDFFVSSMAHRRILRVHADGSYENFAVGGPHLQGPIGMKVDAERRLLWVCTGRYTLFAGSSETPPQTGVLLFDLDDGSLINTWLMSQPSPGEIFNDLALASDGTAYVTTTLFGRVYRISPAIAEMELVFEAAGTQTNGIALGPNEQYLFFTLGRSISRLDLKTGDLMDVTIPNEAGVGTDGLYFVDGSLVIVQPRAKRIARLFLNADLNTVDRVHVLAEDHPDFAYPTTGVVVGNALVFVATSFADVPRNDDSERQHQDVLIHRIPLGPTGAVPRYH